VRDAVPAISEETASIVKRALAIDVAARYATGDDFMSDVKKHLGSGLALDESMFPSDPKLVTIDPLAATQIKLE